MTAMQSRPARTTAHRGYRANIGAAGVAATAALSAGVSAPPTARVMHPVCD